MLACRITRVTAAEGGKENKIKYFSPFVFYNIQTKASVINSSCILKLC